MTEAPAHLSELAAGYTAAWCSQDPANVAAYFSPGGSLRVNSGDAAVGRAAITEVARGFMTAFPDLRVRMDSLVVESGRVVYRWTLSGVNNGPGGGGRAVRIGGFEEWQIGTDGLIAFSQGHFDSAAYEHQLKHGFGTPRFFNEEEVRARLDMRDLIEAMERALVEFSAGRVLQPVRTVFEFGANRSLFGLMPTYVPSLPALGAKLVTVCPGNADLGLGTHQAMIVMLDPETGVPEAILDGRYITEVRTAAVSAVSVRRLAREDAKVLGIVGSGVQARSHFEALGLVREFREVRVWSPTPERLRQFAAETGARAMESAEAVVRGADVVVAVTPSPTPVIQSEWVGEGVHVIAVGSCLPSRRELDPALVARARLFVDSRAAALKEAGDVVMGIAEGLWTAEHIEAELGELPVRRNAAEVTVFKSLGLAVEDLFAAQLVLTHPGI
jgi:ornithine cyclodeaminase/alanine dehydrogenase-like protein (mu-crystallin family)/predicted ester cyclase